MNFVAPCLFGLEGILADELKRLDIKDVKAENGRVLFSGDSYTLARANINLRTAERVLILVGKFKATSFTELFENVKALPFEKFIGKNDIENPEVKGAYISDMEFVRQIIKMYEEKGDKPLSP